MNGTVKWFDSKKGYGFISGDDGKEYFVHQSNIQMQGFRKLDEGDIVDFEVGIGGNGKEQAINVNTVLTLRMIKHELRKDDLYVEGFHVVCFLHNIFSSIFIISLDGTLRTFILSLFYFLYTNFFDIKACILS